MTTTNLLLTLLDVGQKEKEVTINTNFALIDSTVTRFLGDLASDPATTGLAKGTTYFNTATSRLKVLRGTNVWVNS